LGVISSRFIQVSKSNILLLPISLNRQEYAIKEKAKRHRKVTNHPLLVYKLGLILGKNTVSAKLGFCGNVQELFGVVRKV